MCWDVFAMDTSLTHSLQRDSWAQREWKGNKWSKPLKSFPATIQTSSWIGFWDPLSWQATLKLDENTNFVSSTPLQESAAGGREGGGLGSAAREQGQD